MHSLEARIRKQQGILTCSGVGVILFGMWSIARFVLTWFMNPAYLSDVLNAVDMDTIPITLEQYKIITFVIIMFFLIVDLCVRLYVGLAAINEGKGLYRAHITYIIVAIMLAAINYSADVYHMISAFNAEIEFKYLLDDVVDMTVHIATVEIFISAIRVRMLEKSRLSGESGRVS
ncbi:MAG: hypothetical protein Q4D29_01775 [Lachnospiraceae bacterium]|nr:hypothetical protein [Lachnospiraceae bacterium]